ncbi:Uma2 family endonuclease [Lachnospiraceae bacterium 29-84]
MNNMEETKRYTIDDIYNLPEGRRAELVDGILVMMAPPSRKRQEIAGELFGTIREYIQKKNGLCRSYIAPFAVLLFLIL